MAGKTTRPQAPQRAPIKAGSSEPSLGTATVPGWSNLMPLGRLIAA
jgi:hypothetical protein